MLNRDQDKQLTPTGDHQYSLRVASYRGFTTFTPKEDHKTLERGDVKCVTSLKSD